MTQEHIDALVARYTSDAEFAAAIDAVSDMDEAVRVAAAHGLDVTAAELAGAEGLKIGDAELETVAGGADTSTIGTDASIGSAGSYGGVNGCSTT